MKLKWEEWLVIVVTIPMIGLAIISGDRLDPGWAGSIVVLAFVVYMGAKVIRAAEQSAKDLEAICRLFGDHDEEKP
jgi:hypothetical protein